MPAACVMDHAVTEMSFLWVAFSSNSVARELALQMFSDDARQTSQKQISLSRFNKFVDVAIKKKHDSMQLPGFF